GARGPAPGGVGRRQRSSVPGFSPPGGPRVDRRIGGHFAQGARDETWYDPEPRRHHAWRSEPPGRSVLRRFLPTQESIKGNRLLRWLGPRLHEPGLWHLNRRAVARGVAIGVFFGFMIPVAQIPAAAVGAFFARANLWVSAIATLVSNPFTYAPIYFAAYRLGR